MPWNWTLECRDGFKKLKAALRSPPVLAHPDLSKTFKVFTDASEVGLGTVLTQNFEDGEHVIPFASHILRGGAKKYSTSEKECLAVLGL